MGRGRLSVPSLTVIVRSAKTVGMRHAAAAKKRVENCGLIILSTTLTRKARFIASLTTQMISVQFGKRGP